MSQTDLNQHRIKTLNVTLPESVYWHIRECANTSRMSIKEFMEHFGKLAKPFPLDEKREKSE